MWSHDIVGPFSEDDHRTSVTISWWKRISALHYSGPRGIRCWFMRAYSVYSDSWMQQNFEVVGRSVIEHNPSASIQSRSHPMDLWSGAALKRNRKCIASQSTTCTIWRSFTQILRRMPLELAARRLHTSKRFFKAAKVKAWLSITWGQNDSKFVRKKLSLNVNQLKFQLNRSTQVRVMVREIYERKEISK